jgi:hypothetical protein
MPNAEIEPRMRLQGGHIPHGPTFRTLTKIIAIVRQVLSQQPSLKPTHSTKLFIQAYAASLKTRVTRRSQSQVSSTMGDVEVVASRYV